MISLIVTIHDYGLVHISLRLDKFQTSMSFDKEALKMQETWSCFNSLSGEAESHIVHF